MGIWTALGIAIGVAFSVALSDLPAGVGPGAALDVAFGAARARA